MSRLLHRLLLIAFLAAATHTAAFADEPQSDKPAAPRSQQRYELRREHDPNGIGKFYMGREIAHVMGFAGAQWLERSEREEEERISLLVRSLRLKPGQVVADIGAGSGVISIQMAERVLPGGTVMAVDVQQEMLDRLADWCSQYGVENVQPVRGSERKTNLKPQSVDLALMVDVYHEFEYPYEMLLDISRALRPGGRLVFVEYRKEDPAVPIKEVHKMSQAQVRIEAEQPEFNLAWLETIHILPRQHVIVFQKTAGTAEEPK
ncbi:MAG: putative methyltransferase YcgJ [Planctomycetota bacterium]|jgi:ubiquinone/menaquinone biosynthesis C-methylase UbiE